MRNSKQVNQWPLVVAAAASVALLACGGNTPDPQTGANAPNSQGVSGQQPQYGQQPAYGQQQYPQQQGQYPQQQPQQGQYPQQQPQQGQFPQQQPQMPQQQVPQQQVPQQQPTGAAPAPAGGLPTNPLDPAFLQQAAAAAAAVLQQPGSAPLGDPTEAGLKLAATKFAPGMSPDGQEAKQTLKEGEHASMGVTMQAGKCYTIIGFSAPGQVKDLDLTLLAPPFFNMSAGTDGTKDGVPVIGKGNQPICPILPVPMQYKLDIFAKSGAGPVAVQVYSKAK